MGKKKNKRHLNSPNNFWVNMANNQAALVRANLVSLMNVLTTAHSNQQRFQAPHHQQESIMDLTDDNSPNVPMNAGNPGGSQQNVNKNPANQPIFDDCSNDINFTDDVKVDSFNKPGSSLQTRQPINKTANEPVVKGPASNIKLLVQGSKPVTVATSSTETVTRNRPKPTILASENVTTKFSPPTSTTNLTVKGVQQSAIKTEEITKGKLYILGSKQINTRITRDTNPKPQQYIAPTQPRTVVPSSQPSPVLPLNPNSIPRNPRPLLSFQQNYPKGIPRSFLMNQTGVPEPYANQPPPDLSGPQWGQPQPNPAGPNVTDYGFNYKPATTQGFNETQPLYVQTNDTQPAGPQAYSPSDAYADNLLGTSVEGDVAPESDGTSSKPMENKKKISKGGRKTNRKKPNKKKKMEYLARKAATQTTESGEPAEISKTVQPDESQAADDTEDASDESGSPDLCEVGEKRTSAFERLGPVTQPKKPKLTINLMCNKDQSVREVLDETEEDKPKYVPVHLRPEITTSTDETVMKFLMFWPWKKPVPVKKCVTLRNSKSVMILEQEQMLEIYDRNLFFIQVSLTGYPPTWRKEKLLDILLDTVNGKSLIPCFVEFAPDECKFLVIRSLSSLLVFHKIGFIIQKEGHDLQVTISQTELSLNIIDFLPKNIIKKKLLTAYSEAGSLDLSEFTLKEDLSHFIYFPLNRLNNQMDIIQLHNTINWEYISDLNLSHNRLTSIEGFNLSSTTPRLKHLNLSHNYIEKATCLLRCRSLTLRSIKLEGNPLCNDYTDPSHYVKVLKIMFPTLVEIDDTPIKMPGDMPPFYKNYCPEAAKDLIEKFLEIYFPLLDSFDENREMIRDLYHERATLTITTRYKLRYGPVYKSFRSLFSRVRVVNDDILDSVEGAKDIVKLISKWPPFKHDPFTFTVDVLSHDDFVTIFKVGGLVRITAETLAEDEHLLAFTRTFVLHSSDGAEYLIANEMLHWDEPTDEYARTAFQITAVKPKRLNLKLEFDPDEDLKKKLIEIFMKLTEANETISEKCLEQKEWNIKAALEFFMKLLKLDDLESLLKDVKV